MRIYENLFIVNPMRQKKRSTASSTDVETCHHRRWHHRQGRQVGQAQAAYRIEKHREGSYILMQFSAEPTVVKEFERRLRVQDSVIKFLTVRIDETLKRLDKRKKEREKRAHRRPQPVAPQPSLAQQMLGGGGEGAHPLPAHRLRHPSLPSRARRTDRSRRRHP